MHLHSGGFSLPSLQKVQFSIEYSHYSHFPKQIYEIQEVLVDRAVLNNLGSHSQFGGLILL